MAEETVAISHPSSSSNSLDLRRTFKPDLERPPGMGRGSGVPEMFLKVPSEESSSSTPPRTFGEQMKMRGTDRSWAEQEGMVGEEEESTNSSSSSSKKDEPVIQDAENQQKLIE
eukprot:11269646-Karenia_brevis.AAC.1